MGERALQMTADTGSREQALDDALTRSRSQDLAERVGFEPTGPRGPAVFKTAPIDRSGTSPRPLADAILPPVAGAGCDGIPRPVLRPPGRVSAASRPLPGPRRAPRRAEASQDRRPSRRPGRARQPPGGSLPARR